MVEGCLDVWMDVWVIGWLGRSRGGKLDAGGTRSN